MRFFIYILVILLIPIPLKLRLYYKNGEIVLQIFSFKKYIKKQIQKVSKFKKKHKNKQKLTNYDYVNIVKKVDNNPIKFRVKINIKMDYGLEDAADTAILYGIIWSIYPFIERLFKIFFSFKNLNLKVSPDYNGKKVQMDIKIFTLLNILILLINIIYIVMVLKTCSAKVKETSKESLL